MILFSSSRIISFFGSSSINSFKGSLYSLYISVKNWDNLGKNAIKVLVCLNPILKISGSKMTSIAITDFSRCGNNKNELILVKNLKPSSILSQTLSME